MIASTIGNFNTFREAYADTQFNTPMGVAVDSGGNVYVANNERIQEFKSDGTFIRTWGSNGDGDGQFDQPS